MKERLRKRTARLMIPLVVLGGTEVLTACSPTLQQTKTAVSSRDAYVDTGMWLAPFQQYQVDYVSGKWSVDARNLPYVGPQGYDAQTDQQIWPAEPGECKDDDDAPYGELLGKVAGFTTEIGKGGTFRAPFTGGDLLLKINDKATCLDDNGDLQGKPVIVVVTRL